MRERFQTELRRKEAEFREQVRQSGEQAESEQQVEQYLRTIDSLNDEVSSLKTQLGRMQEVVTFQPLSWTYDIIGNWEWDLCYMCA